MFKTTNQAIPLPFSTLNSEVHLMFNPLASALPLTHVASPCFTRSLVAILSQVVHKEHAMGLGSCTHQQKQKDTALWETSPAKNQVKIRLQMLAMFAFRGTQNLGKEHKRLILMFPHTRGHLPSGNLT